MNINTETENQILQEFWNQAFGKQPEASVKEIKTLAPSEKLFLAAASLGQYSDVLDYGCGSGWASIIAAENGAANVIAADVSENAVNQVRKAAHLYGFNEVIHPHQIDSDWLEKIPDESFDAIFCSNVLDVIPSETAVLILDEFARIMRRDAKLIIGMNYYLSPEKAAKRNLDLKEDGKLYVDGILRMVSKSDEEWISVFSKWFSLEKLDHFAWPSEKEETRRLFYLKKK